MRKWFRLALVVLIVALGAWAYLLRPSESAPVAPSSGEAAGDVAAALVTDALLRRDRLASEEMAWRVTQANSTDTIMVIDVEAERPDESLAIAEEIVAPLADSYLEVLIYVRAPDQTSDDRVRRVRWTPDDGYIETTYSDQ
ncbi:MAG: hypothetical protein O2930_13095 [Acidobacteria bacterium]|nr:hypothetical protein [Acidobacteriota bacterium]